MGRGTPSMPAGPQKLGRGLPQGGRRHPRGYTSGWTSGRGNALSFQYLVCDSLPWQNWATDGPSGRIVHSFLKPRLVVTGTYRAVELSGQLFPISSFYTPEAGWSWGWFSELGVQVSPTFLLQTHTRGDPKAGVHLGKLGYPCSRLAFSHLHRAVHRTPRTRCVPRLSTGLNVSTVRLLALLPFRCVTSSPSAKRVPLRTFSSKETTIRRSA